MTIAPGSDIVLDALMAADPAKSRAVAEKLSQMRPSRVGDFDTAVAEPDAALKAASAASVGAAPQQAADVTAPLAQRPRPQIDAAGPRGGAIPPAYRKFEAFVLQTFIESMLPRGSAVNFGKGVAGDVWRSMLAEQLGNAVAKSGGVGIAKFLAAAHPGEAPSDRKVPAQIPPPAVGLRAAAAAAPMQSSAATMLDDPATSA
ncbi:MAG: peptidoglycan hydrolase FlgJ [Alphaproteobacteria bacterium]|nr:peptidoglycan hydrolase FlgJ [Alphaproteobacteria bacterium]